MSLHQAILSRCVETLPLTTIVSVRRHGKVVMGGDGQVSLGNTVMKGNAKKVRRLYNGEVIAGFAGATADAFTLLYQQHVTLVRGMAFTVLGDRAHRGGRSGGLP